MFAFYLIYIIILVLVCWSYSGYLLLLLLFAITTNKHICSNKDVKKFPRIAILVPCLNEEEYVLDKINNIESLNYDKSQLEVYFISAPSTDRTLELISSGIKNKKSWYLIESEIKGKILQLNLGLKSISKNVDIVVCTDMDSVISPDTLLYFVNEFNTSELTGVVGANIHPENCLSIENDYWQAQNIIRILESEVCTSSIVVAPCYAFRRELIKKYPEDCVADDIFVAFEANTQGYKTKYISCAFGKEMRNPLSIEDFVKHKMRKGNAYLVELFRFSYRVPYMNIWWKLIYLTKVAQLLAIPWVLPYFVICTASLLLTGGAATLIAIFGIFLFVVPTILASYLLKWYRRKRNIDSEHKVRNRNVLVPLLISNLVLILAGFSYPFVRQNSSYPKLGNNNSD